MSKLNKTARRMARAAKRGEGEYTPPPNPVAKNMNKFNKPQTHRNRKREAHYDDLWNERKYYTDDEEIE